MILHKQIYNPDTLKAGFERVKNLKSLGVDGIVKSNFNGKDLITLQKDLKTQKYKPKANKRVAIPKPDNKGIRSLGIASIRDKVVQGALHLLLVPILDPLFSEFSFGFIPKRGKQLLCVISIIAGVFFRLEHKYILTYLIDWVL